MSRVRCRGPAQGCRAELLLDGVLERRGVKELEPTVEVRLRSPAGRELSRPSSSHASARSGGACSCELPVPAPELWSPDRPNLYSARIVLRDRDDVVQVVRRAVGLRSVTVKNGLLT